MRKMTVRGIAGLLAVLISVMLFGSAAAEEIQYIRERGILIPAGTKLYSKASDNADTTAAEEDLFVFVRNGGNTFYRVNPESGGTFFVRREDIPFTVYRQDPPYPECWAEEEVAVYSVPNPEYGKETGRLAAEMPVEIDGLFNDYVHVVQGDTEGYVLPGELVPPGGWGGEKYFLQVSLSEFTMTVYKADEEGKSTGEIVFRGEVCIGKKTTPTPTGTFVFEEKNYELWHRFGPRYAPYAIAINSYRWIHGELCDSKDRSDLKEGIEEEFGKAKSGGCVRMHTELAQWIWYHCGPGTVLEIVK